MAIVSRSVDKKPCLAVQVRRSWDSIVLLVPAVLVLEFAVLPVAQEAECNQMVVKRTVAAVEALWRRRLLWQISNR